MFGTLVFIFFDNPLSETSTSTSYTSENSKHHSQTSGNCANHQTTKTSRKPFIMFHLLHLLSLCLYYSRKRACCQALLVNYFVIFCSVLFHGFITNQQSFVISIPEVFAEQVAHGRSRPHDFIDDDVSRQSPSFHGINPFLFCIFSIA